MEPDPVYCSLGNLSFKKRWRMFIGLHVYMFTYLYVYMFTAFITLIKYGDAGSSVFVDVSERVDGDDGDDGEGIKK